MSNESSVLSAEENESVSEKDFHNEKYEENLLFLINLLNTLYEKEKFEKLMEIVDEFYIQDIIIKNEPILKEKYDRLFLNHNNTGINTKYSNFVIIISILQNYFKTLKDKKLFEFTENMNMKNLININNLVNKNHHEIESLAKIILFFVSTSSNKDKYIDTLSQNDEMYIDFFLDIIQNYIELKDETVNIIDPQRKCSTSSSLIDPKRKFSTSSSILFGIKDEKVLFASIDKLRKKLEDTQEEKESLFKNLRKAETKIEELKEKIQELLTNANFFQAKEDDLIKENNYLKNQLAQRNEIELESYTNSTQKMTEIINQLNQKINENEEIKTNFSKTIKDLSEKNMNLEENIRNMVNKVNEAQKAIDEKNHLQKEYNRMKSDNDVEIEKLQGLVDSLKKNIQVLEKDKSNSKSIISSLKDEIRIEQKNSATLNNTILSLKEKLQQKNHNAVFNDKAENQELVEKIQKYVEEVDKKNVEIYELNLEISSCKKKIEQKNIFIKQKNEDIFFFGISRDYKKLAKKLQDESKKKDRDILFLKQSYNELKKKSEEEYNMVSSSLYELGLHLTKIKNSVN